MAKRSKKAIHLSQGPGVGEAVPKLSRPAFVNCFKVLILNSKFDQSFSNST